jgi:hypothetical protein
LKDELGAGVLPSSRFGANAAWFRINALMPISPIVISGIG